MSKRNRKYWTVTNTQIVSANNKSEAMLAAQRKRGVDADILGEHMDVQQITAAEARSESEQVQSA